MRRIRRARCRDLHGLVRGDRRWSGVKTGVRPRGDQSSDLRSIRPTHSEIVGPSDGGSELLTLGCLQVRSGRADLNADTRGLLDLEGTHLRKICRTCRELHGNRVPSDGDWKSLVDGSKRCSCCRDNIKVGKYRGSIDRDIEQAFSYRRIVDLGKLQDHRIISRRNRKRIGERSIAFRLV